MSIPILVEPTPTGYRAATGSPWDLTAVAKTAEEAFALVKAQIAARSTIVESNENPWVEFAGMFQDDPYFDEWQEAISNNRKKDEEDREIA